MDGNTNSTGTEPSVAESVARINSLAMVFMRLIAEEEQQQQAIPQIAIFNSPTSSVAFFQFPIGGDKSGPLPASKESIDAMPRIIVTEDRVEDCPICLDEMSIGGEIREMPCKHGFHSGCIEKWLGIHGSCPICRFGMPVEDDGVGSEDGQRQRRPTTGFGWIITNNFIDSADAGPLSSGSDPGSENSDSSGR
ncbi:hypothetical protein JCGZ_19857 [Jatropha curcas]|uniref:RING-type E3 ubiquitin transferase n=1 Tax=Jatropha curcas TaxID=180498 RepID=A0A067JWG7_JATCU|nr:E3 ubiquitin-protein ligase RNF181 [Jatropha curcas]KDP27158.1 hypothetical protein JCGZ_19857 [Jatropha curcas]